MSDFLAGIGFFTIIGLILAGQYYRKEVYLPRQKAKRTGQDVHVQYSSGLKTFRPDGSSSFHRYP